MSGENGTGGRDNSGTAGDGGRAPRRIVLLDGDEGGGAARILAEYRGAEISGKRLHADLQRLAAEHPGRHVAAEWLGPLGWTRFLWCRR